MRIDWQAYDDGLFSKEDAAKVEALLASDPAARAELAGLRKLRSALAAAREVEPVPMRSLRTKSFKSRSRRKLILLVGGLAVAAALASWTWSTFLNEPLPDMGPIVCTKKLSDPAEVAKFMHTHSPLDVPVLDPAPMASIKMVTASPDFLVYDMDFKGQSAVLKVQPASKLTIRPDSVVRSGVKFYVSRQEESTMIEWSTDKFVFSLSGLPKDDLWTLGDSLAGKTASWHR